MRKFDVTALGELLIDFTENGLSDQGNRLFEANPGGAPCNVLSMLNNLGNKTAFIGKVGNDSLGKELKERVTNIGINTDFLYEDNDVHTTLAFVSKLPNGDRDFSFYRNPGADMNLKANEVNEELIKNSKVFHFGTLSMTHKDVREATLTGLGYAKKHNCLISFDPNLREPLWNNLDDAKKAVLTGLEYTDVLKISDNEIQWLSGFEDFDKGIKWIRDNYDIKLVVLSLGADGSRAYYNDIRVEQSPFLNKDTIETTGAGDTFGACVIHYVLKFGLNNLDKNKITEMLRFANAAASLVTTRRGALMVMPTILEVNDYIENYKDK
jgi:fructokinase